MLSSSQINQADFANKFMPNLSVISYVSNENANPYTSNANPTNINSSINPNANANQSQDPQLNTLLQKVQQQNTQILQDSNEIYNENAKLNFALETQFAEMKGMMSHLDKISPHQSQNPLILGIDQKMAEFHRITESNNSKIKKNLELIPDIQRKKKENDDFFKKFYGEKKVWLDRLKETTLRDDAYNKGFKYLYEAKTIKMLLEGILLEKVQDEVEKVLTVKGQMYGWDVLDEAKLNEERKAKEFQLSTQIANMTDQENATELEQEQKAKWEQEDRANEQKRQLYHEIWRQLWSELWLPRIPLSTEQTLVNQRELMKNVTMEVTFKLFQKLCFDVWKFKNMINSAEEYIVLDKIRRLFPEDTSRPNQDEVILDKMMDMIENLKQEEEIIYCDLLPAKAKLKEYEKSSGDKVNVSTSIERIKTIIAKIETLQMLLKSDSTKLIKLEVEEIRALIKAIPDDNEKKLFKDNLKNKPRLYDKYLPLTTLLMIVSFISIGKKRNKGYQDKIETLNKENEALKMHCREIEGKWAVLREVNEKLQTNQGVMIMEETTPNMINNTTTPGEKEIDFETEFNNCKVAKEKMTASYNEMSKLIGKLNTLQNTFFKKVADSVVNVNVG